MCHIKLELITYSLHRMRNRLIVACVAGGIVRARVKISPSVSVISSREKSGDESKVVS